MALKNLKYSATTRANALAAAKAGGTDAEVAQATGISQKTFRNWIRRYPDFKEDIAQARSPLGQAGSLERLEQRKLWAENWIDECLKNMGVPKIEHSTTYVDSEGKEHTHKVTSGQQIDWRLIDRVLGVATQPEEFKVIISVATPPPDEDEDEEDYLES